MAGPDLATPSGERDPETDCVETWSFVSNHRAKSARADRGGVGSTKKMVLELSWPRKKSLDESLAAKFGSRNHNIDRRAACSSSVTPGKASRLEQQLSTRDRDARPPANSEPQRRRRRSLFQIAINLRHQWDSIAHGQPRLLVMGASFETTHRSRQIPREAAPGHDSDEHEWRRVKGKPARDGLTAPQNP